MDRQEQGECVFGVTMPFLLSSEYRQASVVDMLAQRSVRMQLTLEQHNETRVRIQGINRDDVFDGYLELVEMEMLKDREAGTFLLESVAVPPS